MNLLKFKTRPCKGPDAPTVQDVINLLMEVKDKSLPVFGYLEETEKELGDSIDIINLDSIDTSINDRIDINLLISS